MKASTGGMRRRWAVAAVLLLGMLLLGILPAVFRGEAVKVAESEPAGATRNPGPSPAAAADPAAAVEETVAPAPVVEAVPEAGLGPYPLGIPPPAWSEAARSTWRTLGAMKVEADFQAATLEEVLADFSARYALNFRVDRPEVPAADLRFTFKARDISAEGTLKLLLSQHKLEIRYEEDGGLRVARQDSPLGRESSLSAIRGLVQDLATVKQRLSDGWNGLDLHDLAADLRTLDLLARQEASLAVREEPMQIVLALLEEQSGLRIAFEGRRQEYRVSSFHDRGVVSALLERLLAGRDLGYRVFDRAVRVSYPERLQEIQRTRDEAALRHEAMLARLEGPLDLAAPCSLPALLLRIERALGVPTATTEDLWRDDRIVAPATGLTARAVLDRLATDGIRWAVYKERLCVVR